MATVSVYGYKQSALMATSSQPVFLNISGMALDKTGDIISFSTLKLIDRVFNNYVALVLSVVGVATNVFNCLLFTSQGLRDRVRLCLFSLALVDLSLFFCIFVVPAVRFVIDVYDASVGEEFAMKALAYGLGFLYGLRATSDAISSIIAVERCLCVVLPLQVTHLVRTRTMAATLAACSVLSQLCHIVLPLKFTVARYYVNSTGAFQWNIVQSEIGIKYAGILEVVSDSVLNVSFPALTFVTVSTATAVTAARLRSASRWREKTASTHTECRDRQTAATRLLVLVSCVYILTMAPSVTSVVVRLIVRDFSPYGRYAYTYLAVTIITNQVSLINNALNFCVYVAQSSRMRRDVGAMLGCGQRGDPPSACLTETSTKML